jgi:hypothetical protein
VYIYSACIRLHIQCVYTYTYVQIYRYVCVHSIAHRSAGILLLTAWPVTMRVYRTPLGQTRALYMQITCILLLSAWPVTMHVYRTSLGQTRALYIQTRAPRIYVHIYVCDMYIYMYVSHTCMYIHVCVCVCVCVCVDICVCASACVCV